MDDQNNGSAVAALLGASIVILLATFFTFATSVANGELFTRPFSQPRATVEKIAVVDRVETTAVDRFGSVSTIVSTRDGGSSMSGDGHYEVGQTVALECWADGGFSADPHPFDSQKCALQLPKEWEWTAETIIALFGISAASALIPWIIAILIWLGRLVARTSRKSD